MNAIPQRLKTMTQAQLTQRVLQLEAANEKCGEAIAAAVQAEREACAEMADNAREWNIKNRGVPGYVVATELAAAIRARGNGAAEPPALFDDKITDEDADMLDAEQEEEAAEFLGIKPAKPKRSKRARNGAGRE